MNRAMFELQEADNHLARLKREKSRLDDGASHRAVRDTMAQAVAQETARLKELNASRADKELQLQSAEEKIARQQSRLMSAKSAHEVTSLQRDIAALGKARGDLDEAILTLMDEAETAQVRLSQLQGQLDEKISETGVVERRFSRETARLDAEATEVRTQRDEIAAQLDAVSLQKYNDYAKRFHGVALAHPEKGDCSACGMALTPYNLREAKSQTWPTCESCGRLLFVES